MSASKTGVVGALIAAALAAASLLPPATAQDAAPREGGAPAKDYLQRSDRKSTRLNSSH